jgi:hypothetical protein
MYFQSLLVSVALAPLVLAAPRLEAPSLFKRCVNSETDRSCWSDDFDISTNYYDEVPDTGVVREYYFDLTNTTSAPDGIERVVLSVNGTVPGPTIIADWGDTVGELFLRLFPKHKQLANFLAVVHVTNSMQNNGSSIHFHGIRQNYTNQMDGVASVTRK